MALWLTGSRGLAEQVPEVSVAVGETRVLSLQNVERVIVLNPELLSIEFDRLEVRLTGLKEGRTYVHYWTDLGRETLQVRVTPGAIGVPEAVGVGPGAGERLAARYEVGAEVGITPEHRLGFGTGNWVDLDWNLWQQPDQETVIRTVGTFRMDPVLSRLESGFVEYARQNLSLRAGDMSARLSPLTVDLGDAFGLEARHISDSLDATAVVARRRRGAFSTWTGVPGWASGLRIASGRGGADERSFDYGVTYGSIGRDLSHPTATVLGADVTHRFTEDVQVTAEYARDLRSGSQAYQAGVSAAGSRYLVDATVSRIDPQYRAALASTSERLSASDQRFYVRVRPVDELALYYSDWGIVRHAPTEEDPTAFGLYRRIYYGATLRVSENTPALTYERERLTDTTPGEPVRLWYIDALDVYGTFTSGLTYRVRYEDEKQFLDNTPSYSGHGLAAFVTHTISQDMDASVTLERRTMRNLETGEVSPNDYIGLALSGRRAVSDDIDGTYYVGWRQSTSTGRTTGSTDLRITLDGRKEQGSRRHNWRAELYWTVFGPQTRFQATLGYVYSWDRYKKVEPELPRYEGTGKLRGTVFIDPDGDGHRRVDEPGLAGARLTLDGKTELITDTDGWVDWGVVDAGPHQVQLNPEDIPAGMVLTAASPLTVLVPTGQEAVAAIGIRGQATLAGAVFVDSDGDHTFGGQDFGVAGVPVTLQGVGITSTDTQGRFVFRGVVPGKALVSFDPAKLPANFMALGPPQQEIEVKPGEINRVDLEVDAVRTMDGIVYVDLDGDGQRGPNDPGAAGLVIRASSELFPQRLAAGITGPQGTFVLRNLPAGPVKVFVDFSTAPPYREGPGSSVVEELPASPVTRRNVMLSVLPRE